MWKIMILVCASALPRSECNKDTAIDVFTPPEAASIQQCMLGAQVYLAESGVDMKGYYPVVRCSSGERKPPENVG